MVLCSVWIDGILCKITKHLLNKKILTHKIYFINISYLFVTRYSLQTVCQKSCCVSGILVSCFVMFQRFNANAPKYGYI